VPGSIQRQLLPEMHEYTGSELLTLSANCGASAAGAATLTATREDGSHDRRHAGPASQRVPPAPAAALLAALSASAPRPAGVEVRVVGIDHVDRIGAGSGRSDAMRSVGFSLSEMPVSASSSVWPPLLKRICAT
jgi:hypothetical protein